MAPTVAQHLDEFVRIAQSNSINRKTIDWTRFRAAVLADGVTATTVNGAFNAIRTGLRLLGDEHSSYTSASGTTLFVGSSCTRPSAPIFPLPSVVGYIRVGSCCGALATQAVADSLQRLIQERDRPDLVGWIVDLRGNGGGNMWPMIAGLGPILGDGLAGYFIDPDGRETQWGFRPSGSWLGTSTVVAVTTSYTLKKPNPKVAVLTDAGVASSGEATAIAFRGRANTRSFGQPTCGKSTANSGIRMSDGAIFNITTSYMADRMKTKYGVPVIPDEQIADPNAAFNRAVDWLTSN